MNGIEAPWIGDPDYGHDDKMDYDECAFRVWL